MTKHQKKSQEKKKTTEKEKKTKNQRVKFSNGRESVKAKQKCCFALSSISMNNSKTYDNLLVFVIHEIFFFLKNFVPFDLIVQHDEQWKKHTVPPERRKTKEKRKKNEEGKKEKRKEGG